jgi:hypothetical protein
MIIGDKYILFWENKIFKNLGYYLGKNQDKDDFFCFGDTPDTHIINSRQIYTFDLIFVFRKVYGNLEKDYPSDLYTLQTIDNTRLSLRKNWFYSREDLEKL